jgi:hypothetical protein
MGCKMASKLFSLRDQLVEKLRNVPGVLSVGVGREKGETIFVVSVDQSKFQGTAPASFAGYGIAVEDLGRAVGHNA